jgi:hypothetical protein
MMTLGMSTATFTVLHVLLSFIGIGSGLVVMWGLFRGKRLEGITAIFLVTTVLTSVTGFGFHVEHLLPSHIVGLISLVLLAAAIPARYVFHLAGNWRWVYVVGAATALYLNIVVLIIQSFLKVPAMHALAPEGKEPPFLVVQVVVLAIYLGATFLAAKKFHPATA